MGKLLRILWGITWRTTAFTLVVTAALMWLNTRPVWNASKALESQDAKLEGRVGVVVMALAMPEQFEPAFFDNFVDKIFTEAIPWPINVFAGADAGIALVDPTNPLAKKGFEPTQLADIWGRTSDVDGVPWVDKYKKGKIRFVMPGKMVAKDHGFFLYPERKGGIRTATAKTILKARYAMYAALPNGYLPHYSQTLAMGQATLDTLKARHSIAAGAVAEAFRPERKEAAIRSVLNAGIDTLVLSSVQPIYSDFEELKGSYSQAYKVIEAWKAENPGKKVKLVIAPHMATAESFDALWADHLAATAPAATGPAASKARVIVGLHGLPVSLMNSDSWAPRARALFARISPKLEAVMRAKGYTNVEVVLAAEGFADPPEDPENKLVSVSEEFARAKKDGVDLAIDLPVEFLAENTDMLFTHAAVMFDGLPGYTDYMGPPANTDWSKPYVRTFQLGKTTLIYSGAVGGEKADDAGVVLADAVSMLWSK